MPKKDKKDSAKEIERNFTISLVKMRKETRPKRATKAVTEIRKFIARHLKVDVKNVKVSQLVNQFLWKNGREKIPGKIRVKALSDGKQASVYMENEKIEKKKEKKEQEGKKEEKPEKQTEEQKNAEAEKERKKEEKKLIERQAEKLAMKK